eukprot:CAMPEP_0177785692 /NCGR_PEP_ID=MMETSP0491_2-20121128/20490_1 /TAXON_ID=63592 /ORGANISM="Tetraselmis chuii, Strain PLY429" /LENGTH=51 /DNA_ID=CAMNT_0019306783 /DNA_START=57 /DNA_END=209 /DNA_ORIENTATION=-
MDAPERHVYLATAFTAAAGGWGRTAVPSMAEKNWPGKEQLQERNAAAGGFP